MSHYTCLVILDSEPAHFESALSDILEPFDENMEVEPYERECWCLGNVAYSFGTDEANRVVKPLDDLRKEFHELPEEERPEWQEWIKKWNHIRESSAKKHPLFEKYNPECSDCGGTGTYESTYNQDSKWDWYEVGGRWSGLLLTKDGERVDCARMGDIDWDVMRKESIEKAIKSWEEAESKESFERYFVHGIESEQTKEEFIENRSHFSTFSVLTPDGIWHERGKMGWFASVSDEKETSLEWSQRFQERFLDKLNDDAYLIVVDCHI